MKKLIVLLSLVVLAAACQKEDIRPNGTTNTPEVTAIETTDDTTTGTTGGPAVSTTETETIGTGTNPDTGENDPGSITDPLRKKDKRDNK